MKILSLSSVYPNPQEPGLGLFVRSRLEQMARMADVKVIAPIPLIDYSKVGQVLSPAHAPDPLEVFRPRWFYPPGGTSVNVICLFLRLLPLVRSIRRSFPFDLIDAHFGYPEGVAAALLASIFHVPFTITLRGSEPTFAASPLRRKVLRWAMRRAAHIIAVSDELREFAIREGVAPPHATTVPNGIDPLVFYPRATHVGRGPRILLSAGELIEVKGHHLVIRATKALLERGHDVQLWIAGGVARGGAPYERELQRLTAELGLETRVRFLGWIDRRSLPELLSAASLFCLASFTEGWPNVVNEALACGAPAVASAVGGVRAMLASSRYGIAVPPRELTALIDALDRGLNQSWDRAAISAWGQSRRWAAVASEVIDIQRSVVDRNRTSDQSCAALTASSI
ncbi:MAG TPA: glycosyltransferase [Bryobacteraceae bacterium]|jgi:glycosyltransferase involved in cell wall biosynthesis